MADKGTGRAGLVRAFRATGVVVAIVVASMIGLHDWADGMATHDTPTGAVAQHDTRA